jgi:signal transduction histidine kinase
MNQAPEGVEHLNNDDDASTSTQDEFEKFIYLLSHDVRNSSRALIELPQWIEEDLIEEGYQFSQTITDHFEMLHVQSKRLDQMLSDLLIYSRVGRLQSVGQIDLVSALEKALRQISVPDNFKITTDIQHHTAHLGENDIVIMLKAIVENSITHHDKQEGNVYISTRKEGNTCVICVQDDGPGIDKKYHDKVFEVMKTLKSRDDVEGSGMGLAITKRIVEFYGGSASWKMEGEGNGSSLEIRLPIKPEHPIV